MGHDEDELRAVDGERLGAYFAGLTEFRRTFPRFFRVVGDEVCARLAPTCPGVVAHVGEDYRGEAIDRWNTGRPSLDWVAFSFPGYSMWDLHVGVVARLEESPPICQAGVHWTTAVAGRVEPRLSGVDWTAAVGTAGERAESREVAEIQQRDRARPLDLRDLGGEVTRFAERAVRYYTVVRPLLERRGGS